jgi:predicted acetyltransferase
VIELRTLTPELHGVVKNLWQLYRHDMSDFVGTHTPAGLVGSLPDERGRFHERALAPLLGGEEAADGYVFFADGHAVGFAFVVRRGERAWMMGHFFLARGLRGHGGAAAAARELFQRHAGSWEVPFQEANTIAGRFWRRLAREAAAGEVQEERRPVPGKPEVPPDVWLSFRTGV